MTPEQHARVREIFTQARRLPVVQRAAFIEKTCGLEPEIRREVESLLEHVDCPLETEDAAQRVAAEAADLLIQIPIRV